MSTVLFLYHKTYQEQNKNSWLGISASELKLEETRIQTVTVSYITYLGTNHTNLWGGAMVKQTISEE